MGGVEERDIGDSFTVALRLHTPVAEFCRADWWCCKLHDLCFVEVGVFLMVETQLG